MHPFTEDQLDLAENYERLQSEQSQHWLWIEALAGLAIVTGLIWFFT